MTQQIKIKSIEQITHDVKSFRCEKPDDYKFIPGQATEVSVDKEGWKDEARPFTFTSLNEEEDLEFTIKSYRDHDGVTHKLNELKEGDHLIVRDIWGAIEYKGPGTFIAGGAGVTPFIAILRDLNKQGVIKDNRLLFANTTDKDIILKNEFNQMLGDKAEYIITDQKDTDYEQGYLDKNLLKSKIDNLDQYFYVCGPPEMTESTIEYLKDMGVADERIVKEE